MMIGARTAAWAKSGPTAKNYVQDGLIAMWDGIENAGWGVHDPNATVWKDLSKNGYDIALGNPFSWESSCCYIDGVGGSKSFCSGFSGRVPTTQEMVVKVERCDLYGRYIGEGCGLVTMSKSRPFGWIYAFGHDSSWDNGGIVFGEACSFSAMFGSRGDAFFNGVKYGGRSISFNGNYPSQVFLFNRVSGDRGITGRIYCARIYNRILSNTEVSANYAIDKARFNLPDAT